MTRSLPAAIALVVMSILIAPAAHAMWSPALGRFINRDPGLTPMPDGGHVAVMPGTMHAAKLAGQLAARPYAERGYHDGMNLYVGYFVPNDLDPSGLTKLTIGVTGPTGRSCGYADIVYNEPRGTIRFSFRRKEDPGPCGCCDEYGWINHARVGNIWRFDNDASDLPGLGSPSAPGSSQQPGEDDRPKGPDRWKGNPWYGGVNDSGTNPGGPGGSPSNPRPSDNILDAPTDPKVTDFVAQLACTESGYIVFSIDWHRLRNGDITVDLNSAWTSRF